jgi:hypothetical protein
MAHCEGRECSPMERASQGVKAPSCGATNMRVHPEVLVSQQPLKEMKAPSGLGRVGVKGSNGKD